MVTLLAFVFHFFVLTFQNQSETAGIAMKQLEKAVAAEKEKNAELETQITKMKVRYWELF